MFTMDELEQTPYIQGLKAEIRREARLSLVIRQLTRQVGSLELEASERVGRLSDERLDALAEALLDFSSATELHRWLDNQAAG